MQGLFFLLSVISMQFSAHALIVTPPTSAESSRSDTESDDGTDSTSEESVSPSAEYYSGVVQRKSVAYTCKEGNKTFETKIAVEESYGSSSITGDIEVKVPNAEPQIIPLNLSLLMDAQLLGSGKGQVTAEQFSSENGDGSSGGESEIDSKKLIEVARKGVLEKGYYVVPSKIEMKSGSCLATAPLEILVSKSHIEGLEAELKNQEKFDKKYAACSKEISSGSFQGIYTQMQICALQTCEAAVNSYMAAEKRSGVRSGYVDKVKLAAYGYYLESASATRKTLNRLAKANGAQAECPAKMLMSKNEARAFRYGTSMSCAAPVKYPSQAQSACMLSVLGRSEENRAFGYFDPNVAVFPIKSTATKFDLDEAVESYARASLEAEENEKARVPASGNSTQGEDDPDVAAQKAAQEAIAAAEVEESHEKKWKLRLK